MSSEDWGDSEPEDQPPSKRRTPNSWLEASEGESGDGLEEPEPSSRESRGAMALRRQTSDSSGRGNDHSFSEVPNNSQQTDRSEGNSDDTVSLVPLEKCSPEDEVKKGGGKPLAGNKTSSTSKQTHITDFYHRQGENRLRKESTSKNQGQMETGPGMTKDESNSEPIDKTPKSENLDSENFSGTVGTTVPPVERTQADSDCETRQTKPVVDNKLHASGTPSNTPIDKSYLESNQDFVDNCSTTEPGMKHILKHFKTDFNHSVDNKGSIHAGTNHAESKAERKDAKYDSRSSLSLSHAVGGSPGPSATTSRSQKLWTDTRGSSAGKSDTAGQASTSDMKGEKGSSRSGSYGTAQQPWELKKNDKEYGNDSSHEKTTTYSQEESPNKRHSSTSPTPSGAGNHLYFNKLPQLRSSPTHVITVMVNWLRDLELPMPFPVELKDKWDNDHVRMPYSPQSLHQAQKMNEHSRRRWDVIKESLSREFKSSYNIENAIKIYNPKYADQWNFEGLHAFFKKNSTSAELHRVVSQMAHLALRLPTLCTQSLPLLRQHSGMMVTISQEQAACLLANAFFCTFPRRNASGSHTEYSAFPDINFNRLFEGGSSRKMEKLQAIFHYFHRVCSDMPKGLLTFHRKKLEKKVDWERSTKLLTELKVDSDGTIENEGKGMLQVDFANKFVGGGVLGNGLVQEEIRFIINPELIVSRLFTEVLGPHECLIVTGSERFSNYMGYGDTFKWSGQWVDNTPRDQWMRRTTEIVAIDAFHFYGYTEQFDQRKLDRELNKAFCGFSYTDANGVRPPTILPPVATGNWGCGAFGGDTRLKALLQALAAAEAGRNIVYFTFGDRKLKDDFDNIHTFLKIRHHTVGAIYRKLVGFHSMLSPPLHEAKPELYGWLMHMLQK